MSGVFERRPAVTASGDGSVAAGGDIGTAVTAPGAIGTQYIGTANFLAPPIHPQAASVDCPPRLTNVFERPGVLFKGRGRELRLLSDAFASGEGPFAQALHGLGGIGKSTLAAHWVAECVTCDLVWWITADSPAAIDAGLASLAAELHPALATVFSQEQLSTWALQWLASHDNWLLVLDDVSEPADISPLMARAGAHGRFLITTRRATGWRGVAEPLPVDVLDHEDAVDLFLEICPDAGEGVAEICAELGCLPLAVHQAAAYCEASGTSAQEYLELLAEVPGQVYATTAEGRDPERTVARVWHITLDRLAPDPTAVAILLLLAWYAPDGIPRSLLDGFGDKLTVRSAVGRLAAHSMIKVHRDTGTLSVHGLVQAVSRKAGEPHRSPEEVDRARDRAASALVAALPDDVDDPADWPTWRALLPHVEAMAVLRPPEADSEDLARALSRAGWFAAGQGMPTRARELLLRAETGLVRLVGPEHLSALTVRSRLIDLGPASVEEATRHADLCHSVLGDRHPETISARSAHSAGTGRSRLDPGGPGRHQGSARRPEPRTCRLRPRAGCSASADPRGTRPYRRHGRPRRPHDDHGVGDGDRPSGAIRRGLQGAVRPDGRRGVPGGGARMGRGTTCAGRGTFRRMRAGAGPWAHRHHRRETAPCRLARYEAGLRRGCHACERGGRDGHPAPRPGSTHAVHGPGVAPHRLRHGRRRLRRRGTRPERPDPVAHPPDAGRPSASAAPARRRIPCHGLAGRAMMAR
ncbi:hypothetical protein IPT68_19675 [Streptomyces chromofuscus]|uniref:NB-ARC domain-containing protein n=1 Tax=Streptomyces chromofuscus TaxID=42881 RepID=A0A7M2T0B3_STRCW|nr:hypothetical protein IPT68_19675 [Streptomyces chromofuscus]